MILYPDLKDINKIRIKFSIGDIDVETHNTTITDKETDVDILRELSHKLVDVVIDEHFEVKEEK